MKKILLLLITLITVITLSACAEQLTVTFNTMGGNNIPPVEVDEKSRITLPPEPIREGYTFLGWYMQYYYLDEYNNDTINVNTTLYAKWEGLTHRIHVVTNNSDGDVDNLFYKTGDEILDFPVYENPGFSVEGYYSNVELTDEFNVEEMPNDDLIVYIKWVEN